jgi:quercetin dioxygenase-like cupin family protein
VLGALADDERAAFERHLLEGCGPCEREVASFEPVVAALGELTPPLGPPPEVRERLLERLSRPWVFVRAADVGWGDDAPGLATRPLYRDAVEGRVTSLVRLVAGARHPRPRHAAIQELFVLQGDLTVGDQRLGVGDYGALVTAAGPDQPITEDGCVFVLATSERAETLAHSAAAPTLRAGATVVRASEADWHGGAGSEIWTRQLSHDPTGGRITAHVRMAPGAHLPAHRHLTAEQLYMLAGDAHVDGKILRAGDYYRMAPGTAHDVTYTERGCEFLLIASAVELLG